MQKLLTIVIPTYNMQAYLNRCLDSLIVRDDLISLIEVLIINDGSKDNSSSIAHKYEELYTQSFRVIDKENGNYGSCVNRGLAEATGKYIKVLDADDWFDTDEFEKYLIALEHLDADMVLTGYNIVNAKDKTICKTYRANLDIGKVYDFQQMDYDRVGVWMMHAVTYRVEMLKAINYFQTEGISYTDTEWTYIPMHAVNTIAYFDYAVYQYLIGRDGQTMDTSVLVKSVWQHEHLARRLILHAESLIEDEKKGFGLMTLERQIKYVVDLVYKISLLKQDGSQFNNDKLVEFDSFLKEHKPDYYRLLAYKRIKPFFPVCYVRFWREHKRRFPVDFIRNVYRKLKSR